MTNPSPADRLFSAEHEWVKIDAHNAIMEVTRERSHEFLSTVACAQEN